MKRWDYPRCGDDYQMNDIPLDEYPDGEFVLYTDYQRVEKELEMCKKVIAWANNSLYGSHGFFLSDRGGEPNEHHLDNKIEDLKTYIRKGNII